MYPSSRRIPIAPIDPIETKSLPDIARAADVIVSPAGVPHLVRGYWVKSGAIVIDAGINRIEQEGRDKIVGDCAADEISHAKVIMSVPDGVGPMTINCLLSNIATAAEQLAA